MVAAVCIKGKRFGRMLVIKRHFESEKGRARWLCLCDCGNEKVVDGSSLRLGVTRSCGCLAKDVSSKNNSTHGMHGTKTYQSWSGMKNRCLNKKDRYYKSYGGRGISICDNWINSFQNFFDDMGERPENTTLDRIDNNKGYYKENCRWASPSQQSNNKRNNVFLTHKGKTLTLSQWSREVGIRWDTIRSRIDRGWSVSDALETPVIKY